MTCLVDDSNQESMLRCTKVSKIPFKPPCIGCIRDFPAMFDTSHVCHQPCLMVPSDRILAMPWSVHRRLSDLRGERLSPEHLCHNPLLHGIRMLDAKVKLCWRNGEKSGHPRNRIGNEVNIQASNIGVWYSLITGIPMVYGIGFTSSQSWP